MKIEYLLLGNTAILVFALSLIVGQIGGLTKRVDSLTEKFIEHIEKAKRNV